MCQGREQAANARPEVGEGAPSRRVAALSLAGEASEGFPEMLLTPADGGFRLVGPEILQLLVHFADRRLSQDVHLSQVVRERHE